MLLFDSIFPIFDMDVLSQSIRHSKSMCSQSGMFCSFKLCRE